MPHRIAGIEVHKRMLAVVVSDVEVADEYQFERRQFGSNPAQLRALAEWLLFGTFQERSIRAHLKLPRLGTRSRTTEDMRERAEQIISAAAWLVWEGGFFSSR